MKKPSRIFRGRGACLEWEALPGLERLLVLDGVGGLHRRHPVLDVPGAAEFFGFQELAQASPGELSQGGRQRLALAALRVGAPGVLVLGEPATGQDASHMRAFLALAAGRDGHLVPAGLRGADAAARPVLQAGRPQWAARAGHLRGPGHPAAPVSNTGWSIDDGYHATGLDSFIKTFVLSCDLGIAKECREFANSEAPPAGNPRIRVPDRGVRALGFWN